MHRFNAYNELSEGATEAGVAHANAIVVLGDHLIAKLAAVAELHQKVQEVFILEKSYEYIKRKIKKRNGIDLEGDVDGHQVWLPSKHFRGLQRLQRALETPFFLEFGQ